MELLGVDALGIDDVTPETITPGAFGNQQFLGTAPLPIASNVIDGYGTVGYGGSKIVIISVTVPSINANVIHFVTHILSVQAKTNSQPIHRTLHILSVNSTTSINPIHNTLHLNSVKVREDAGNINIKMHIIPVSAGSSIATTFPQAMLLVLRR